MVKGKRDRNPATVNERKNSMNALTCGRVVGTLHDRLGPSFAVHIWPRPRGWRVYVERQWPVGVDTAQHMPATFRDLNRAEIYAMALTETHGDCAIIRH